MHTTDKSVLKAVLYEITRRVPSGHPVSKKEFQEAYRHVRALAILETTLWKKLNIEERLL